MNTLDQIYEKIDEMMSTGHLKDLDLMLASIPVEKTDTDLLLGYLTATLPVKRFMAGRKLFYESVRKELTRRGEADVDNGLLKGLE